LPILAACLVTVMTAGCGTQHYQSRLEASRQQYAAFAELNDNLAPPWQEKGLTLRVPLGFQLAWQPKAKKAETADDAKPADDAEGEGEKTEEDPETEPPGSEFFPRDLTGLVGVWTAELPAAEGRDKLTAYLYVLTNHDLWLDARRQDEAKQFFEAVIDRDLRNVAGLPADYRTKEHWDVPRTSGESYLVERFYSRASFPTIRSEDGAEAALHVCNFKAEDAEVVLLFVIPAGAKLTGTPTSIDPIELTMKTLTAQAERPRQRGEGGTQDAGGF
jgi:hypothetical protein